jgi:hypothetical protein
VTSQSNIDNILTSLGQTQGAGGLAGYHGSVPGGQSLFSVTHLFNAFVAAATGFISLKNPADSVKNLYIHRLYFGGDGNSTIRLYRDPTISGGLDLVPLNRTGGSLSSIAIAKGYETDDQIEISDLRTKMEQVNFSAWGGHTGLEEGTLVVLPGQTFLWTGEVATIQDSEMHTIAGNVVWWER